MSSLVTSHEGSEIAGGRGRLAFFGRLWSGSRYETLILCGDWCGSINCVNEAQRGVLLAHAFLDIETRGSVLWILHVRGFSGLKLTVLGRGIFV